MHILAGDVAKQCQTWLDLGREEAMRIAMLPIRQKIGDPEELAQLERDAWAVVDGPVIQIWDVRTERSRSNLRAGWTEVPGKPK